MEVKDKTVAQEIYFQIITGLITYQHMQGRTGCGASRRRSDGGDFGDLKKERKDTINRYTAHLKGRRKSLEEVVVGRENLWESGIQNERKRRFKVIWTARRGERERECEEGRETDVNLTMTLRLLLHFH